MLTRTLWSPRATPYARIGGVSEQGGGRSGKPRPATPSGTELIGLGFTIALSLILPAVVGLGADALFHSSPIAFLIGLLGGITAASAIVVMQFRRYL
jgi:hypothetical protein